jgi:CRISPR-associated protein Csb2
MPTLRLRFPGGRYHATPWGHHVNEGQIEWPPSPWRLLRALIACGFSTQHWTEVPLVARGLVQKLASTLPSYRLPPASAAHSRHFMPVGSVEKGRERTTLVLDTWANVGENDLLVHWNCELNVEETQLLRKQAECLGYLGRSESWTDAELLAEEPASIGVFNARPHQEGFRPGQGWEQTSLMAALPPDEYADWRRTTTEKILAEFPLPAGNKKPSAKLLKDRARAVAQYPENLIECLTKDTAWWKLHRWSQPPGSQRVLYWRESESLQVGLPYSPRPRHVRPVTTMLLGLTTASGNRSALPPNSRTLPQAELFHRAIVGRVAMGERVACEELTGRDQGGRPLRQNHLHAHILPVDLDGDGHLDHLIVHASMGLRETAQRAIRTLRRTWTKRGDELQVALAGSGDVDMLRSLPAPLGHRIEQLLGPPGGARVWTSKTPFVPPRYLKRRGANTLFGQINAELASRRLPSLAQIEELPLDSPTMALRHYVRARKHGGVAPPLDVGLAIRLYFHEPVLGPITLGYASHFGLGLFVAELPRPKAAPLKTARKLLPNQ